MNDSGIPTEDETAITGASVPPEAQQVPPEVQPPLAEAHGMTMPAPAPPVPSQRWQAPPPTGGVAPEGVSAKSKKVLVWIIVAVAAFLVLAVGAVVTVMLLVGSAGGGGKETAQQYVDAIAKGDAKTANALARVKTSDKNNVLLSNAVLSKATRITAPTVTKVIHGNSAELVMATVSYKLDGKSFTGTIDVERDDDGWFVARGLAYSIPGIPYGVDSFRIAGVDGELDRSDRDRVAYPGVYKLLPPNKFHTLSGDTKLLVSRDFRSLGKLELLPSDVYVAAAQKALNAQIDACAAMTVYSEIEDCGLDLGFPSNILRNTASVAVTVGEYPVVSAAGGSSTYIFNIDDGVMSAVISGPDYGGNAGTEDITVALTSYGIKVGIVDGEVVVKLH